MTTLTADNPVTRETAQQWRGRPLVVRLTARYIEIWEKNRRDKLVVRYDDLLEFAQKVNYMATRNSNARKAVET